jgi:hypothetical protein
MNTNQIKLILMNYSEDEYVPELKGIYINNMIMPLKIDIFNFIRKYNLNIQLFAYKDRTNIICTIYKLVFYMNLLNFNGYSSWQIMLTSIKFKSLNRVIHYFGVKPQKSQKYQRYIIYRDI